MGTNLLEMMVRRQQIVGVPAEQVGNMSGQSFGIGHHLAAGKDTGSIEENIRIYAISLICRVMLQLY